STLSLTSAYALDAPVVVYLWSFVMNSTLRSQTLPFSFQNRVRPCSMALPIGANGPVRSVSTPSVMVSALTPTSVLTAPLEDALLGLSALVEQAPAARSSAAKVLAATVRPSLRRLRRSGIQVMRRLSFSGVRWGGVGVVAGRAGRARRTRRARRGGAAPARRRRRTGRPQPDQVHRRPRWTMRTRCPAGTRRTDRGSGAGR